MPRPDLEAEAPTTGRALDNTAAANLPNPPVAGVEPSAPGKRRKKSRKAAATSATSAASAVAPKESKDRFEKFGNGSVHQSDLQRHDMAIHMCRMRKLQMRLGGW